ncbi:formate dehydrogenase [Sphingopyxis panaciterrae]|uniref:molybdopterin-containing oxidoreductase family protein n=1 Tax=Sphingopyxis panaciterrae TaxID=363841 RepID=UPI0014211C13|nr:molybdopterin-dependent oxidoreductase [Sphingopyxis panaciterrae]NIJ36117.1 formate dehydrogenase [Sphingopyxis panaciterrae]
MSPDAPTREEQTSFCRLCEAFCGTIVTVEAGRPVKLSPDRDNPHTQGHICVKGAAIVDIANDPDRVLRPLKRTGGPGEFTEVSWDEALDDIAARLSAIIATHGPEAVATYFGNPGAFSTDTFMSSQWFLQRIGSTKFYAAGSQDSTSRHLASWILYGVAFRNAIPDLPNCDFLIITGANPLVSHGGLLTAPRMRHDLDAIAARGRVIVIDPRRTETAKRYEHLAVQPDADAWLHAAMLKVMIDSQAVDEDFLTRHCTGWDNLKTAVRAVDLDAAAAATGLARETIETLARDFAAAPRAAMYGRVGLCRGQFSTIANMLLDAINIAGGKFGKVGGSTFGAFPLAGGGEPLSGYGEHRTRIGNLPVVAGLMPAAALPDDILEPGEGQVRAMMIVAGNPVLSAPGGERLEQALASLDLLFSIDLYVTESNRFADYILPAATFLEKDDIPLIGLSHMVRPYIQYARAAVPTMGEARDEKGIFDDLVRRIGLGSIAPTPGLRWLERQGMAITPLTLVELGLRHGPFGKARGADALTFAKLADMPHGTMLDMPLTYDDWAPHIATGDGRIRLWHPILADEFARFAVHQPVGSVAPTLKLFSQRKLKSMNSWMHNPEKLARSQEPALLVHPADAARHGLADGGQARVSNAHGAVEVRVEVTDDVVEGAACYPHGWGHNGGWRHANTLPGANINVLLGLGPEAVELVSGTTFIDGIPVSVEAVGAG